MAIGRVVRAIAGFYYVEVSADPPQILECAIRGKLKLSTTGILVGDMVEFSETEGQGVITGILPRKTLLKRPYIANVNLIVLVFAHQNPDPTPILVTKFLILAEASGIPYLLVFNKSDLAGKGKATKLANIYREYGYRVLCTSVLTKLGKRTLQKELDQKVTVFAGPSGVGKSALLNTVAPGFKLVTGELSQKISRGKHTTREVQLLKIKPNSYAADTPGFSQIDFDFLDPPELAGLFPDLREYRGKCKFNSCLHRGEPGCKVSSAVEQGTIKSERYQIYLELLKEVQQNWDNRYR